MDEGDEGGQGFREVPNVLRETLVAFETARYCPCAILRGELPGEMGYSPSQVIPAEFRGQARRFINQMTAYDRAYEEARERPLRLFRPRAGRAAPSSSKCGSTAIARRFQAGMSRTRGH